MRVWSWPVIALLPLAVGCGRDSRSLESGWFGRRPPAVAAAMRDSAAARDRGLAARRSSAARGRTLPADAPPKVTLGGTNHVGTLQLDRSTHRSGWPAPVASPADIKASLLRLRALQSNLYALGRTYTDAPDQLGYAPEAGVNVKIVWASNWGWAAIARDDVRPYLVCTMYVGAVPHEGAAAGRIDDAKAGVPNCTPSDNSEWRGAYPQLLTPDSARSSLGRGAATLMRHDLVKLVRSQRTHRAVAGVYARRIAPMSLHYAWHPGVMLRITEADAAGWAAEATYDQWPGHSCVIWGGKVTQKPATAGSGKLADVEEVPACDE